MSWLIYRLLIRIAEVLDRSLLTVPELDDEWLPPPDRGCRT